MGDDQDATIWSAVAASLEDKDRLCPVLAGVGWLQGDRLQLQLADGDLNVVAPSRLLQRVLKSCNGQSSFNDIVAQAKPEAREELASFLDFLLVRGALVDAINLAEKLAGFGFQTSPIGQSAPEDLTDRLRTRNSAAFSAPPPSGARIGATPLDEFFAARRSASTFDDAAISVDVLHAWLWTAAGVVADSHPQAGAGQQHRTLASAGGLYLLRFFVVLIRSVGPYPPGVYAVDYGAARHIALAPVSSDVQLLYRCFFKPWQLTFACGAVFVMGDVRTAALRYRNRALPYLLLEAGAALQNLALSGAAMGLGSATIGGYCEEHVAELCQVNQQMVLGSAIFGARATPEQRQAVALTQPIDFVWGNTRADERRLPFHVARARVKGKTDSQFNTFGKDRDPRLAYIKAHAETIERQAAREPKGVIVGRIGDVPNPLNPVSLVAYSESQYASAGFPFGKFDPTSLHRWISGIDLLSGQEVSVPADLVYLRKYMAERWPVPGKPFSEMNSSGCAAGDSREFALQAALLELIERDAFMQHWLVQRPGRTVPLEFLLEDVRERIKELRDLGCTVVVQKLDSVAAHAVLVSATHPGRYFTCVAAAARFDLNDAVAAGLDELQTSVYTRFTGMDYVAPKPEEVTTPEDHTMLYAQRRYFERAHRLLTPVHAINDTDSTQTEPRLEALLGTFAQKGLRPCFVDITPERHFLDQGRVPISVVRAFVPTLIPISFGYGREPRAMVAKVHRCSFFPHPFP